jgi:DNA-binding transcriptional LysR family regulator
LDLRPSGTLAVAERLDRGEIDLALGSIGAPAERFCDIRLFEDRFACLLRQDHPAVGADGKIDAKWLADLSHLEVSSTGEGTGFVDDELARLGLERRVVLRAPLLATVGLLTQSDMVAVMTERAARAFAFKAPLQVLTLPFPSPTLPFAMLWHRRQDDQAAHRWLRGIVSRVARTL